MAARKGSTGTSRGSSGKSNTKKSTATRKTTGTAKKSSGSTGRKKQTKSSTAARSRAAGGSGGAAGKNAAAGTGSAVRSEISILVAFALMVFGTLSVFGLCGSAGAVIRSFLYGVFGILACVVPLLFFLAVMFFVSNLGNGKALGKLVAALLIVPDLCGLIQLVVASYVKGETLKEIYDAGTGGGWLGGAVKQALCSVFDVVGAYLVLVLILLICLVVITEKSLTRWLRAVAERILGRAREDYDYRVEQNEENRARNEERREEQRIQREERRRQAEERRRQEDERREERQRRTDHKVRGVEISDNTVIGSAGATVENGAPAGAAVESEATAEAGRESKPAAEAAAESGQEAGAARKGEPAAETARETRKDGAKNRTGNCAKKYKETDAENPEGADSRKFDTDDRRGENPGGQVSEDSSNSKLKDFQNRIRWKPENAHIGDPWEENPAEMNPKNPGTERKFYGFRDPENETGDVTVEWWNPHETGNSAPEEATGRPESELPEGEDVEEPEEAVRGEKPEPGKKFGDSDEWSDGVRKLDFMQDRVNRRMEEFETAKKEKQAKDAAAQAAGTFAGNDTGLPGEVSAETGSTGFAGAERNFKGRTETGTGKVTGGSAGAGTGKVAGGSAGAGNGKPAAPPPPPYRKPPTSLLNAGGRMERDSQAELNRVADKLQDTLKRFGVNVTITDVSRGPSVTRYELLPEAGTRVNRITSLSDDIKLALAATDIRIEAPIPGKSAIGIEVPNKRREMVYLKDLVESGELKGHPSKIAFAAGKDIAGKVVVADIAKMPHMLIAGTTGSGKSVFTNSIIMTILLRATPEEVKLIIIDPKVVEFGIYNGIPHLMTPVVTDPRKAAEALKWATAEMSRRYQTFANENVRDLKGYNKKIEREHLTDKDGVPLKKLPQIVIIIDELADLMMVAAKDVEETICRLAQLARAAGIHLIIATQRPSVDVVTGLIKANIPSRVALLVSSGTDSRTIIDMNGAEKLLGNGDMLFAPSGYAKPVRLQGAFVSDEEVRSVVDFLKKQVPEGSGYDASVFEEVEAAEQEEDAENRNERDPLFADAGRFLIEKKKASVSLLQRKFRVGFNRAARIIDQLEEAGVVGEELGTKPRNVLMTIEEFEEFLKS